MKQYRPNVDLQRRLYSSMVSFRVLRRHQGKPLERTPERNGIPDNSEPWLPGGVRSVADALWISDRIKEDMAKWQTGREKDQADILFLERKAERESLEKLPSLGAAEATHLLERFLTPNVAAAACEHADGGVRNLALQYLKELAAEGDPFAAEILRAWDTGQSRTMRQD